MKKTPVEDYSSVKVHNFMEKKNKTYYKQYIEAIYSIFKASLDNNPQSRKVIVKSDVYKDLDDFSGEWNIYLETSTLEQEHLMKLLNIRSSYIKSLIKKELCFITDYIKNIDEYFSKFNKEDNKDWAKEYNITVVEDRVFVPKDKSEVLFLLKKMYNFFSGKDKYNKLVDDYPELYCRFNDIDLYDLYTSFYSKFLYDNEIAGRNLVNFPELKSNKKYFFKNFEAYFLTKNELNYTNAFIETFKDSSSDNYKFKITSVNIDSIEQRELEVLKYDKYIKKLKKEKGDTENCNNSLQEEKKVKLNEIEEYKNALLTKGKAFVENKGYFTDYSFITKERSCSILKDIVSFILKEEFGVKNSSKKSIGIIVEASFMNYDSLD